MKSAHFFSFVMALALTACGGSPAEELADQQADLFSRMAGLIEGLETIEDFEDSREELRLVSNEITSMGPRWMLLEAEGLSGEEADAAVKSNKRLGEAMSRYAEATSQLAGKPELWKRIQEIMQEPGDSADR
jgi:hypothetical protein